MSLSKQCHYVPKGENGEEDLALMRRLDELYNRVPRLREPAVDAPPAA